MAPGCGIQRWDRLRPCRSRGKTAVTAEVHTSRCQPGQSPAANPATPAHLDVWKLMGHPVLGGGFPRFSAERHAEASGLSPTSRLSVLGFLALPRQFRSCTAGNETLASAGPPGSPVSSSGGRCPASPRPPWTQQHLLTEHREVRQRAAQNLHKVGEQAGDRARQPGVLPLPLPHFPFCPVPILGPTA